MSEQSYVYKIMQALALAKLAETGCTLNLFDVIELLGHIKALEEAIALDAIEIIDLKNTIIEAASQFTIDKKAGTFEESELVLVRMCSMGAEAMIEVSALEAQLAVEQWIPVSELPKVNCEYYLAELTNGRIEKVIYNGPGHRYTTWMIAGTHEPVDKLVVRYCQLPHPP